MRLIKEEIGIDLPAAEYWLLRLDTGFDKYCAVAEHCTFQIHSMRESINAHGQPIVECVNEMSSEVLPSTVHTMLGMKRLGFRTTTSWHRDWFDNAHAAQFESELTVTRAQHAVQQGRTAGQSGAMVPQCSDS